LSVVYQRRALADLESISDYISRDNPNAARKVITKIEQSLQRLNRFPFSGRVGLKAGTRELSVPRLPYLAVYKVVEESDRTKVEIIAIYHTARSRKADDV
jgi:toxin ParE1/3/4